MANLNNQSQTAKHTPGPWEQFYITAASTNEVLANGNRIALVLQYDVNGNRIADFQTCEANARLIAAAPELLEALEQAIKLLNDANYYVGMENEERSDEISDYIESFKSAINKATGGTK